MICSFCGHQNLNENAPFCGQCGKPVGIAISKAESGQAGKSQLASTAPHGARIFSKKAGAIAALIIFVAITGLVIVRRSRTNVAVPTGSASTTTNDSAAPAEPAAALPQPQSTAPSAAPQPDSASSATTPSFTPGMPVVTASSQVPVGTNIVASDFGGEIESVKGAYGGPGLQGEMLINGAADASWQPDSIVSDPADVNDHFGYPQEFVFSFYKRDTALISSIVIENVQDTQTGPTAAEIWASKDNSPTNFQPVAAAELTNTVPVQTLSFTPIEARFVKVRLVSGPDNTVQLHQIEIVEATQPGYSSLLARHPDLSSWKPSVRHAAQRGIDWLEAKAMDWQEHQQCYGCHVQSQTIMGLSIAQTNNYLVNADTLRDLVRLTTQKQDKSGNEKDEGIANGHIFTATHLAAMGIAYYDEANGIKNDPTLKGYVDWILKNLDRSGAFQQDMTEIPIAQGTMNSTANAVTGLMEVFSQTGDERYKDAAYRSLAYIASKKPTTTQDKVFKIMALSHFGTLAQRALAQSVLQQLESEQNPDGGWPENDDVQASGAFATGQVLYALREAGESNDSPVFTNGVRYLLKSQDQSGCWVAFSNRPSNFAPTMWAVIALAGNVETPSADSLKAQLDKYGRVVLYINFDFNKSTIRPDGKPIIAQVLKLLTDNPDLKLSINGHTDNVGTRNYNLRLSEQRAAAVVAALVAAGISHTRLDSAGFGPDQPIADNATEKGRAKNRRVELVKM